ncbi:MAG: two-component system sensor histidine kinase NtrB [Gemmataceae bacterium]
MRLRFSLRFQVILVVTLFAASLTALLLSALGAIQLPAREREAQRKLTEASRRMADQAAFLLDDLPAPPERSMVLRRRLTDIANRTLEELQGAEGGYYLTGDWNEGKGGFIAHAYPSDPHRPPEPLGKKHGKKALRPKLPPAPDPPPNEKEPIHEQCVTTLTREENASAIVQVRVIGPSRVMIVTEPVGRQRPALMSTWVMTRLTSPEHTAAELGRFQAATGLAMAGILAALVLTANLGLNLRRERMQREQLGEELRRAEHLAALGKLLAGVAHEVRNPLAAIRSTVQLYQRLPSAARDPSALDAILHGVDRLNALVSRLLFFVRASHEKHHPIDFNGIVQEALTLLRTQAETRQVVVRLELAGDLPSLSGSPQALQQVVLNLATNALQAMPNGGVLLCRTVGLKGPPGVELMIADTGPGIAARELPHLFEPFHTTRPEGTGLGLALCRAIVQQHGGRIELGRLAGWGAVFRVTLPLESV